MAGLTARKNGTRPDSGDVRAALRVRVPVMHAPLYVSRFRSCTRRFSDSGHVRPVLVLPEEQDLGPQRPAVTFDGVFYIGSR